MDEHITNIVLEYEKENKNILNEKKHIVGNKQRSCKQPKGWLEKKLYENQLKKRSKKLRKVLQKSQKSRYQAESIYYNYEACYINIKKKVDYLATKVDSNLILINRVEKEIKQLEQRKIEYTAAKNIIKTKELDQQIRNYNDDYQNLTKSLEYDMDTIENLNEELNQADDFQSFAKTDVKNLKSAIYNIESNLRNYNFQLSRNRVKKENPRIFCLNNGMQNSRERSAWYRVLKNEQKQAEKLGQLIRLASRPGINNSPDKKTSNFLETRYHQMVS